MSVVLCACVCVCAMCVLRHLVVGEEVQRLPLRRPVRRLPVLQTHLVRGRPPRRRRPAAAIARRHQLGVELVQPGPAATDLRGAQAQAQNHAQAHAHAHTHKLSAAPHGRGAAG